MSESSHIVRVAVVVTLVVVGGAVGVLTLASPAASQSLPTPSIPNASDMATGADVTTQSFDYSYSLPGGLSATCTIDTSTVRNQGVTIESVDISNEHPDHDISGSVTSSGDVEVSATDTDSDSEGQQQLRVTVTANTSGVTQPQADLSYSTSCGGATLGVDDTDSSSGEFDLQAAGDFDVKDTGVQSTADTQIQSDDTTIDNDTTLTQSIDLDLVVPDDADGDGDTYTVTIDTQQALANGINVTGAAVENDPSGSASLVEVAQSPSVTADENVTLAIREAAADRNNGNTSQEVITVSVTLDGTTHSAGTFRDATIEHEISDEVGDTTTSVTFSSNVSATPPSNMPYDKDGDGIISQSELQNAASDYSQGKITLSKLADVARAFARS